MAIYGQSLTIQYIAWDTVNNVPKTGDASNHTLRWVKDGTAAAPTNSPSEVDATNAPGVYKLTLTASETQCWVGTLCGKSSTSGVVIMPVTLTFERLPTAAPGSSGGLPVIGSAPLTNLDAAISSRSTLTAADVWSYASRTLSGFAFQVTVGGYTTGQSPSEQLQSLGYSSSRAAKLDNLDAAVSSRLAASSYIAPDNASISAIKTQTDKFSFAGTGPYDVKATLDGEKVTVLANEDKTGYSLATADVSAIADAVWDETTSGHQTAGTYGKTSEWTTTASGVWDHASRTLSAFGFTVTVDMSQTLPTSPGPGTVGEALKRADTLRFTGAAGEELVLASVDEQAIADAVAQELQGQNLVSVVVQPIVARAIIAAGDGGVIVIDRYERLVASWQILDADLRTHDLRLIVYTDTSTKVAEYSGAEISVTYQEPDSIVSVNGADTKTPPPGKYLWKLTSQTIDRVLLRGRLTVLDAPDAA